MSRPSIPCDSRRTVTTPPRSGKGRGHRCAGGALMKRGSRRLLPPFLLICLACVSASQADDLDSIGTSERVRVSVAKGRRPIVGTIIAQDASHLTLDMGPIRGTVV